MTATAIRGPAEADDPEASALEVSILADDLQADRRQVAATIDGAPAAGTVAILDTLSSEARQGSRGDRPR